MYVLDTNTLIYLFKGQGNVSSHFLQKSPNEIAIPAIVLYELEYGIAKSSSPQKRQKQLNQLTSVLKILPFESAAAKETGKIRNALEKMGLPIGPYDLLIAGTTIAIQGTLVTNNTREFERVPNLKLENWF